MPYELKALARWKLESRPHQDRLCALASIPGYSHLCRAENRFLSGGNVLHKGDDLSRELVVI